MNKSDYHIRYFSKISDIQGVEYDILIWEHNDYEYSEPPEAFVCAGSPVKITQKVTGNFRGASATLIMMAFEELKYVHLFNRREGDYLLEILSQDRSVSWIGVVVPGYYSEEFREPPFHIKLTAVDGLGRTKELYGEPLPEDQVVRGSVIWDRFVEGLEQCNVIDEIIVQNVIGNVANDFYEIMATDWLITEKNTKRKPFYNYLLEFCRTFDFQIVQISGKWLMWNGVLSDDTGALRKYTISTGIWAEIPSMNFTKNVNNRVLAGGLLTIIPPISTMDVVWKRTTYNVGSNSGLYNSQFLDGMDGWNYQMGWWNDRQLFADQYDVMIGDDIPPFFHDVWLTKTAIQAIASNLYLYPVSNRAEFRFWKLTSLPFHISNPDRKINLKFHTLVKKADPDDDEQDYWGGPYPFNNYIWMQGDSGQWWNLEWINDEPKWVQCPPITGQPPRWFPSIVEGGPSDTWSDLPIFEELSIPEAGKLFVHVGGVAIKMLPVYDNGYPGWFIHEAIVEVLTLNQNNEWVPEYEEILRFQSDVNGFTENEVIPLEFANKYESLADGNFYVNGVDQPEHAGVFEFSGLQHRIQDLLIYKKVNERKRALESLKIEIEGITQGVTVLQNVPGRPGVDYHADELSFDLRMGRTSGKFTERDETFQQIEVMMYSNERKLDNLIIG